MVDAQRPIVHCFAERLPDGQWQAFSIQFGLAAQADSFDEVRGKLFAMVKDYIEEAVEGEDREYCEQLLSRRAPFRIQVKYAWIRFLGYAGRPRRNGALFDEWFSTTAHC